MTQWFKITRVLKSQVARQSLHKQVNQQRYCLAVRLLRTPIESLALRASRCTGHWKGCSHSRNFLEPSLLSMVAPSWKLRCIGSSRGLGWQKNFRRKVPISSAFSSRLFPPLGTALAQTDGLLILYAVKNGSREPGESSKKMQQTEG